MTVIGAAIAGVVVTAVATSLGITTAPVRRRMHSMPVGLVGSGVPSRADIAAVGRAFIARVVGPTPRPSPTADMVALLDAVARALQSGAGVHAALRSAVPVAGVQARGLSAVLAAVASGRSLADALVAWQRHQPTPEVALAAAVLAFGLDTGGSLARAVDGAAATLRERLALAGEVRVLATQARASAVVVGGAPVGFTALVVMTDPRVGAVLFTTPVGWGCLTVGIALEVGCVLWMRSLVARTSNL
jgi:tight adherence protein B